MKNRKNIFYPGNVIRTKEGSIEIVYKSDDEYTSTVFYNMENASAGHSEKTVSKDEYCSCGMMSCDDCMENKPHKVTYYGMEDATLVAHTVKEWIMKSLSKGFDF